MFRLIRRRDQERGAVAVMVAVLVGMFVLTGVAALTIDAGSLYAERRVLQNAADAASLALAQVCAAGDTEKCSASWSGLKDLANLNSPDDLTEIDSVCFSTDESCANLPVDPAVLVQCTRPPPDLPSTASWVEVRTKTQSSTGNTTVVHKYVANLKNRDYDGKGVRACARAYWAPTSSGPATIPVTISVCEYNAYTDNAENLAPPPPYPPYPGPIEFPYEHAIYQHDERAASPCDEHGPSGADFPGGFGYLLNDACKVDVVTATGEMDARPGNPNFEALNCNFYPHLSTRTGEPIFLPIYAGFNQADRLYTMDGIAAFWLTGFSTSGNRQASEASGRSLCTPSQTCLYGWFTSGIQPYGSVFGGSSGTPRGAMGVGVAG